MSDEQDDKDDKTIDLFASSEQISLIDVPPDWSKHWTDMPGYRTGNSAPWQSVVVHFRTLEDRRAFAKLVEQNITELTKSVWFPKKEQLSTVDDHDDDDMTLPRYPVYIVSKGRWESRLTALALDSIGVPYKIVVEPQEFDNYAAVLDSAKILTLPFSNLGQGSIPARNWIWTHAIMAGSGRHWILDDNIDGFVRQDENRRVVLKSPLGFTAIEKFTDSYQNIGLSGFNYRFFAPPANERVPPYFLNTRIYSAILIKNDLPFRWRGRYNEDTDLSLRVLKAGWCTVLFNAFKINKIATMQMKGGNTDELYKDDGRLKMAQSLQEQHPDIVTITEKWGRFQHQVDYSGFRQKLVSK